MIEVADKDEIKYLREKIRELRSDKLDLRKYLFTLMIVAMFSLVGNVLLFANTYVK
jgi:hypothetical protein